MILFVKTKRDVFFFRYSIKIKLVKNNKYKIEKNTFIKRH